MSARDGLIDVYANALSWNTYLAGALALAGVIIVGQQVQIYRLTERASQVKPVFVRIDELGRHDLVSYDEATQARPREHELRTALRTFVVGHFSRMRSVVTRDFHESLYFLKPALQEDAMRETKKDIDAFLSSLSAEEVDIVVRNVKLVDLEKSPYTAEVAFDKLFYQTGTRQLRKPAETYTLHLSFELADAIAAEYLQVNPLGLRITKMRLEQAFKP
jgi:type IV secretory pathway TrbF-like protein